MKRITLIFVVLFFLSSCSMQENVSPEIYVERLCKADENMMFDESVNFISGNVHTYYFSYTESLYPLLEIRTDGQGNAEKINLACTQTDKVDLFLECVKRMISVYSPEEKTDEILAALYPQKTLGEEFTYYETQWYIYSAVLSENGLFFSTENKKLSAQNEVELSLKPNDIVEY